MVPTTCANGIGDGGDAIVPNGSAGSGLESIIADELEGTIASELVMAAGGSNDICPGTV